VKEWELPEYEILRNCAEADGSCKMGYEKDEDFIILCFCGK
jgi:hypothetical protein